MENYSDSRVIELVEAQHDRQLEKSCCRTLYSKVTSIRRTKKQIKGWVDYYRKHDDTCAGSPDSFTLYINKNGSAVLRSSFYK